MGAGLMLIVVLTVIISSGTEIQQLVFLLGLGMVLSGLLLDVWRIVK